MKGYPAKAAASLDWPSPARAWYAVAVLTLAIVFSFVDRTIMALMVEPIKADLGLSDTQIGLLHGFAFALLYTLIGLPIGWAADRKRRNLIIASGIFIWSLMTAACGMARNFWHLFAARVGVGIGEAALSPPAYSIMADYFPPQKLGRAIGIYSAGVYLGAGLAFILGGVVVQLLHSTPSVTVPLFGALRSWQLTFILVGLPGVLVALLMLTVREPIRRQHKSVAGGAGLSPLFAWFKTRRMVLLSLMFGYAFIGIPVQTIIAWAPTYLIRYFHFSAGEAGVSLGVLALVFGASGMIAGGWLVDRFKSRGAEDAPMRVGLIAALGALPFAVSATLVPNSALALVMLGPLLFFVSCGIGAAPTGIQLLTPNQYRAQISALYMLILNLIATGCGPALTALATDFIFADEKAVGASMAMVNGIAICLSCAIFFKGMGAFSQAAQQGHSINQMN